MQDESDKYDPHTVQEKLREKIEVILGKRSRNNSRNPSSDDSSGRTNNDETPPENSQNNRAPSDNNPAGGNNNGGETPPENPQENGETKPVGTEIGISTLYPRGKKPKEKEPPKDKPAPTPPDRDKKRPADSKETDIMKAIWAEIVGFYTMCLDGTVDTVLDFFDYILYPPKKQKKEKVKDEDIKKTPADYGDELFARYKSHSEQFLSAFNKAHHELKGNVEKEKSGIPPKWETWPEQPTFYEDFKNVVAKARADANSPEAKVMEIFDNAPEVEKKVQQRKLELLSLAINLAILDEIKNPTKIKFPPKVSRVIKDIEMLVKDASLDSGTLKEKVRRKLATVPYIEGDGETTTALNEKLRELEEIARGDESKRVNELFKEKLSEIKDLASPIGKMEKATVDYYEKIFKNIEKIRVAYRSDPEARKTKVKEYVKHCKDIYEKKGSHNSLDNFILGTQPIGECAEPNLEGRRPFKEPSPLDFLKNRYFERRA